MQESCGLARKPGAMSVSSEVQRTLVKSPPELWAELSDPATLGRHLGELGEIRIVRIEPERAVAWEAAETDGGQLSGRVEIEPSGWGTKVTLSASRVIADPQPEQAPEAIEVIPEQEPDPEPEPGPEPEIVEPEPRPGFFARLFRRRKEQPAAELTVEPELPEAIEIVEPAPEEAVPVEEAAPEADIAAELAELEQQTTAVLTRVLDTLGAAHHRPFSRA
jgi:hypothetical protein